MTDKRVLAILILVCVVFTGCGTSKFTRLDVKGREIAGDWIRTAHLLYKMEDYDEAFDYYQKVSKGYPNTSYAKEADKKIKKLNRILNY